MDDTGTVELVVVRHGQSAWNVESRFTGQVDVPLSEQGVHQADALARRCAGWGIGAVVTSDLRRAYDTGLAVTRELGLAEPLRLEVLRERWSTTLQGLSRDDIEARFPGQLAAWREARAVSLPGENEEYAAFAARITQGLRQAALPGSARVLVVAHAGVFVVLDQLLGEETAGGVGNAEGRRVRVLGDGTLVPGDAVRLDEATRTSVQDP